MDTLSIQERSACMARVRSKDTQPELVVRRIIHGAGYRYRLHRRDLPGSPDLVFPSRHKVIFVHGCFWHGHDCPRGDRMPKSNQAYWSRKLKRNKVRDLERQAALTIGGWKVLVIWECETRNLPALAARLRVFLGPRGRKKL